MKWLYLCITIAWAAGAIFGIWYFHPAHVAILGIGSIITLWLTIRFFKQGGRPVPPSPIPEPLPFEEVIRRWKKSKEWKDDKDE